MAKKQVVCIISSSVLIFVAGCTQKNSFPVLKGLYLGQKPPGMRPEVFAPGIISHGFHEHGLTISPAGDEMLFTTSSADHQYYAIVHVQRKNNVWSQPEIASFSGKYMDMGPRFSVDGKRIFFCSKRPVPGSVKENSSFDIWVIDKIGTSLSEPVHLGSPLNTDSNEAFPSIAASGTIYFHYWEEKGSESDIYYSRFKNGQYEKPRRLEYGISTELYEGGPYISPDESYLLFQAIRPDSYHGNTNIYISYKKRENTWSQPVNLGEAVNSSGYPISPMVSPDGKYLFFATNSTRHPFAYSGESYSELLQLFKIHLHGYGTLWWADAKIIEECKSEEKSKKVGLWGGSLIISGSYLSYILQQLVPAG